MYQIRAFRNSDPPHLARVWRTQPPQRGLAQPVSAAMLELCVFSKQFFEPDDLLIATLDGEPVGFAHAGFGPNEAGDAIDTSLGSTQMLMLRGDLDEPGLADELIAHSERRQRARGATVHYAGGVRPLDAFYLGLYGGSELPGILDSDPRQAEHFLRNRYEESARTVVLQRELARYRFGGPRETRSLRRDTFVEQTYLPAARDWWEACVTGGHDRIRFTLHERSGGGEIARVVFWDIEPLASAWGIPTVGMIELWVDPAHRRQKVATHLLNEALKLVQRRGASVVEAQTMAENAAALSLYESLGFVTVDRGRVLRRAPT
ncbi:MAG: GNAT family N-acetyltransferase [Lacipirellulaceae bacterium]